MSTDNKLLRRRRVERMEGEVSLKEIIKYVDANGKKMRNVISLVFYTCPTYYSP